MKLNIYLFILILIFWNILGCIGIYTLKILAAKNVIPGSPQYPFLGEALLYQIFFIAILILSYNFFKKNKTKQTPVEHQILTKAEQSRNNILNYIFLITIALNNLIIILNNGIILFNGDYQSRFDIDASSIQKAYIPFICWGLFILNLYQAQISIKALFKKYGLLIFICISSNMLNATRGFAFFTSISLGCYIFYYKQIKLSFKFIYKLFIGLFAIYLGGQLINVFRTYGIFFESIDVLKTFSEDSFNEIRSFATILKDQHYYTFEADPIVYFNDFISRIFPSIFYKIIGLNRMDYWNQSWESLSYYVWGKNEVLYGLRYGLVGEIYVYAGKIFICLFAIIYGKLLTLNNKYTILIITYIIYSIPYGMLIFPIFIITILMHKLIKFIYK